MVGLGSSQAAAGDGADVRLVVYFGRTVTILTAREHIKRATIAKTPLAASTSGSLNSSLDESLASLLETPSVSKLAGQWGTRRNGLRFWL